MNNNIIWVVVGVLAAIALIIFIISNVSVDNNFALVPGALLTQRGRSAFRRS